MPNDSTTIEHELARQQQQYRRDHLTDEEKVTIEDLSTRIKGWGGRMKDAIEVGQILQTSGYGRQDACEFVDWLQSRKPLTTPAEDSEDALEAMAFADPAADFGFKEVDDVEPDRIRYAMIKEQQADLEESGQA